MTLTDKTGTPVAVEKEAKSFTVSVDGKKVGLTAFADHDGQRVFPHTEVDEEFGGRGLATVLIGEALAITRADGLRIVPICPTVKAYVAKHPEFEDIADRPTPEILRWLREQ